MFGKGVLFEALMMLDVARKSWQACPCEGLGLHCVDTLRSGHCDSGTGRLQFGNALANGDLWSLSLSYFPQILFNVLVRRAILAGERVIVCLCSMDPEINLVGR